MSDTTRLRHTITIVTESDADLPITSPELAEAISEVLSGHGWYIRDDTGSIDGAWHVESVTGDEFAEVVE